MTDSPATIYHIARAEDWARARREGTYAGGALCRRHGFIHFSSGDQLAGTLARFFPGAADLVLLAAETRALGAALRWEPAPDGELFPHVHALLPVARIACLGPIALNGRGEHVLPEGVAA